MLMGQTQSSYHEICMDYSYVVGENVTSYFLVPVTLGGDLFYVKKNLMHLDLFLLFGFTNSFFHALSLYRNYDFILNSLQFFSPGNPTASINYTVVVRNCVVDDGGTNSETEIGRESHCGWMRVLKYEGRRMRGCILSCDTDACNIGNRPHVAVISTFSATVAISLLVAKVLCQLITG